MSTEIATMNDLPAVPAMLDGFASQQFLPRMELYTASKNPVKEDKFPANHWAVIPGKDRLIDAGMKVLAYPLGYRYMAMDFRVKGKVSTCNDQNATAFKEMQAIASAPKVKGIQPGCSFGLQFLLHVKDHGFVSLFCGTYSFKLIAPALHALIYNFTLLDSHIMKNEEHTWRAPNVVKSAAVYDLPPLEDIKHQIEMFKVVSATVETKDADMEGDARAV